MQCVMVWRVTQALCAFVVAGLLAAPCVQCTRGEHSGGSQLATTAASGHQRQHLRASGRQRDRSRCPGHPPCNGNGECDEDTATCWCRQGFASSDCSTKEMESFKILKMMDPRYKEIAGRYRRVGMYLQEGPPQGEAQFLCYDSFNEGWAISKLNSSCKDDTCFFAYGSGSTPPPKGYVFGDTDKHVYYRQLIFDDAEVYGDGHMPGIHVAVSYTPDPNTPDVSAGLSKFNGRYVQQPRYLHSGTGKYAIMPLDLKSPGKTWALLGLLGEPKTRKWQILATATDPSYNRYMVPKGPWKFPDQTVSVEIEPFCDNHVAEQTCESLEEACGADHKDSIWVQRCCRATCGTCDMPAECPLPETALLQMAEKARMAKTRRAI